MDQTSFAGHNAACMQNWRSRPSKIAEADHHIATAEVRASSLCLDELERDGHATGVRVFIMNDYKTMMEKLNPPLPPEAKQLINKLQKGKILRYKIDRYSVGAVIAAVTVQFLAYWYQWPWYSLALVLFLMRPAHLAEHNHAHLTLFKNYILNEGIGWLMFLNCGIPLQSYREQHVRVHHQGLGTPKDWTSPWSYQGTSFPNKPVNRIYYYLSFMLISILECGVLYLQKPLSKSTFNFVMSMIVVGTAMTAFAIHDVFNFFFFYATPWIVTYVHLAKANWSQHVNCEYTSVYTTSISMILILIRGNGALILGITRRTTGTLACIGHCCKNFMTPMWRPMFRLAIIRRFGFRRFDAVLGSSKNPPPRWKKSSTESDHRMSFEHAHLS